MYIVVKFDEKGSMKFLTKENNFVDAINDLAIFDYWSQASRLKFSIPEETKIVSLKELTLKLVTKEQIEQYVKSH